MSKVSLPLLAAVCLAFFLPPPTTPCVRAGTIKNISTGFDDATNSLLPDGAQDTDYVIAPGGTGGHIGEIPLVRISPIPGTWLPDSASPASRWLVLPGTGLEGISVEPGTFFFKTTVDLTGFDPATAQIKALRYAADNKLIAVEINGTTVFSQDTSFAEEFQSFIDLGDLGLGLFHSGQNDIQFEVFNQLDVISPMGLRVEGSVDGQPLGVVPEPSGLTLAGLGALFCALWGYRRRREAA